MAGQDDILLGRADVMPRNPGCRVQVLFPVESCLLRDTILRDLLQIHPYVLGCVDVRRGSPLPWTVVSSLLLLLTPCLAVLNDWRIQQIGRSQEHDADTNDTGGPHSTQRVALSIPLPCSPRASRSGFWE